MENNRGMPKQMRWNLIAMAYSSRKGTVPEVELHGLTTLTLAIQYAMAMRQRKPLGVTQKLRRQLESKLQTKKTNTAFPVRTQLKRTTLCQTLPATSMGKKVRHKKIRRNAHQKLHQGSQRTTTNIPLKSYSAKATGVNRKRNHETMDSSVDNKPQLDLPL